MRLSIFNFSTWQLTWLVVLLLTLTTFGFYEYHLSRTGYHSSVTENKDLWAWQRARLDGSQKDIAILGASRIQLGVNTNILRQQFPNKNIIGLTINGRYPLYTLAELANQTDFSGTVIVSLTAQALEPVYWDMQQPYTKHFRQSSFYQRTEARLRAMVQHRLRFLNSELNWQAIVNQWSIDGQYPKRPHVKVLPDLSKQIDYSQQDKAALTAGFIHEKAKNYQEQPPMSPKIWQQQIKKLSQLVQTIHRRGGKVILVRMPTDQGHWQLDEQYYPKQQFWDTLATIPHAQTIHFRDYPQLSAFTLADSSHLDQTDAKKFTHALIALLQVQ